LICSSEDAITTFVAAAKIAACNLLMPYGYVVIGPSTVLRIKRAVDAVEIDNVTAGTVASFELAADRARRRQWPERVDNAGRFGTLAM
jgi:hypothetical protein